MQEIWKPIPQYERFYEVSNHGRARALERFRRGVSKAGTEFVRRMPPKMLRPALSGHGYYGFSVTDENKICRGVLLHRMVAGAFIENPENLPWINHKDGNKLNNHASNLEWCTPSYNILHALRTGLMGIHVGSEKGGSKLVEEEVFVIKKMIKLGFNNKELAAIFKVSSAPISYIRNNKAWTHVPW